MTEKSDATRLDYIVAFGGGGAIPFSLVQVLWAWLSLISLFMMAVASAVDAIATIGYFLAWSLAGGEGDGG